MTEGGSDKKIQEKRGWKKVLAERDNTIADLRQEEAEVESVEPEDDGLETKV